MLTIIAGPCVIESYEHMYHMAETLKRICEKYDVNLVFKSSFDKANRTSITSYRGVGIEKGMKFFAEIKKELNVKTITDIHEPWHADFISEFNRKNPAIDIIQIPALLSRQTDLILAAAKTDCHIMIKKGQFMSPYTDIEPIFEKIKSVRGENHNASICERGTVFGYNYLINDFKGVYHIMKNLGYPVVFDVTHSVQMPGGIAGKRHGVSEGKREFIAPLAKAAVAIGIDTIFMEVHDNPDKALSDAASMLPLDQFENLVKSLLKIRQAIFE